MTASAQLSRPAPVGLPHAAAPFIHGGHSHREILTGWLAAACVVAVTGMVLFGAAAARVVALSVVAALASDAVMAAAMRRRPSGGAAHAALTGLLLALTLPATVTWYVPVAGAITAVVVATWMFGGFGHYLWQPALVGRVVVQFLFAAELSFSGALNQSPVLAPGSLLTGDVVRAANYPAGCYRGWRYAPIPSMTDAFLVERPVQALRRFAEGKWSAASEASPLSAALRDDLPPWEDTVLGTVPGGIGEPCTIALIVVGIYLVYRGDLRWQIPVVTVAAAAIAATMLPILFPSTTGKAAGLRWMPGLIIEDGNPVGMLYVLYHLTGGQLLLGALLLAGDMLSRPLTARGQVVFAAGIGVLTIMMRLYGMAEGECYWSILIMNTFVGPIDRRTKRRMLGA